MALYYVQLICLLKFATINDKTLKALKMIVQKIKILNTTSKSYKVHYIKNEAVDYSTLQINGEIKRLIKAGKKPSPGQYLDIALKAGQYKIYYPAKAFDPPAQSVTYIIYVLLKALLPVCMKYTAQDESRVANIA